jgi:FkbM family methyltransferase
MNPLVFIRRKYHPLFHLRRFAIFREFQRLVDPDVRIKAPSGGCVFVKLLRDLSLVLSQGDIEKAAHDCFDQLLRHQRPDLFMDVGANVGFYSWQARNQGVPFILMFEPDLVNARLISRTIKANRYANIFLIPCAISESVGVAEFLVDHASGATGSLVDHSANATPLHSAYGMKAVVGCPTINLDAYVDYCRGKRVVLKIDVEGAEESVFVGGRRFFQEVWPWVIVECFQPSRLNWLADLGYRVGSLDDCGNYLLTPPKEMGHAP